MTKDKDELATDPHRLTRTFVRRTSPNKNSYRFARKIQNKLYKAKVVEEGYFLLRLTVYLYWGILVKKGYDYDQELWRQDNRKDFQWGAS